MDQFDFILTIIVIGIYGSTFLFGIIFAFAPDKFTRLEQVLNTELINIAVLNPLSRNIDSFNEFLMRNNTITGLLMSGISVWIVASLHKLTVSL